MLESLGVSCASVSLLLTTVKFASAAAVSRLAISLARSISKSIARDDSSFLFIASYEPTSSPFSRAVSLIACQVVHLVLVGVQVGCVRFALSFGRFRSFQRLRERIIVSFERSLGASHISLHVVHIEPATRRFSAPELFVRLHDIIEFLLLRLGIRLRRALRRLYLAQLRAASSRSVVAR